MAELADYERSWSVFLNGRLGLIPTSDAWDILSKGLIVIYSVFQNTINAWKIGNFHNKKIKEWAKERNWT